jgi:Phage tail sheath C-terminal domain/Phage tail sheath protein subtilisin-like domain
MAETFNLSELIVPGVAIRVQSEGLIGVGGISTGNIGIVGTAQKLRPKLNPDGTPVLEGGQPAFEPDPSIYGTTHLLSDYATARSLLGNYDAYAENNSGQVTSQFNLMRAIELMYLNGARTVFARPLPLGAAAAQPTPADYTAAFTELLKDEVNILVAPQLSTTDAKTVLGGILEVAENNGRDAIAVIGSDAVTLATIKAQIVDNDRIVMATPGIQAFDAVGKKSVALKGTYTAAAVAGLLSTLPPQFSPTNKFLPAVSQLSQRFGYGEIKDLLSSRFLVLEDRQGIRVVRGLTTESGAFKQITTRRIVDFAKAGIRQACDPFIGKLNNQRVRKAMQGAIDGFLTSMVQDEALTGYKLDVTATRADEIAGRAIVTAVLRPTFSIDFVAVTLVLE